MKHPLTDIRLCAESDLAAVLDLFEESIRTTCKYDYSDMQIEAWVTGRNDIEKWKHRVREQYFVIAKMNERIAGFASLEINGHIDMMYVHPDFHGKGVARALFESIEVHAREQRLTQLTSNVSKTARPFFEKMGFVVEKEQFQKVRGVEIENYRMVTRVRP